MVQLLKKSFDLALLHVFVVVVWIVFVCTRALSLRFRKTVEGFEATYQFRSASSARRLDISNGHVSTHSGVCASPDYEIYFIDLFGSLRHMVKNSNDVLWLVLENKIDHSGNIYYLFKLGYLFGLIERSIRNFTSKVHPHRQAAENAGRA